MVSTAREWRTEAGLRSNINVAIQYLESWLHHAHAALNDGRKITLELYRALLSEEMNKIKLMVGEKRFASGKFELAKQLFDQLVTEKNFIEFLTLRAYD